MCFRTVSSAAYGLAKSELVEHTGTARGSFKEVICKEIQQAKQQPYENLDEVFVHFRASFSSLRSHA